MAEYIEREEFAADLKATYNDLQRIYDKLYYQNEKEICSGQLCTLMEVMMRVKDWPAADVALVVHGRWGNYEPYSNGCRCSKCNITHRSCTAYCPHCGAKMDLEGGGGDGQT